MVTDIWMIFPQTRRPETSATRNRVRSICKERKWEFQERPVKEMPVTAGGRNRFLLSGADADALYRRLHVSRVGVLCFDSVSVPLDPIAKTRDRLLIDLQTFSRYKSFYAKVSVAHPDGWLPDFERWQSCIDCDGEHDPRCLPFHIFKAESAGLEVASQRDDFSDRYGKGSARRDNDEREWRLSPRDFHGTESAQISGYELRPGFHWDVTPSAGYARIVTPLEVWQVANYINIYPSAHIRGRPPHARKVYPQ